MAAGNYAVGAFSNTTLVPIQVGQIGGAAAPYSSGSILTARYHLTAGAGVSGGTANFQELGGDGTWRNIPDITALTLSAAGEYSGTITGPFHGLRISLGAVTGGTVSFAELLATTLG